MRRATWIRLEGWWLWLSPVTNLVLANIYQLPINYSYLLIRLVAGSRLQLIVFVLFWVWIKTLTCLCDGYSCTETEDMRYMEESNFALEPYLTFWKCTLQRPQQASHWRLHVFRWSLVAFWYATIEQAEIFSFFVPVTGAQVDGCSARSKVDRAPDCCALAILHFVARSNHQSKKSSANWWAKLVHEQLHWCFYVKPNAERWTCSSRSCYPSQYPSYCFTATSFLFALMLCPKLMGLQTQEFFSDLMWERLVSYRVFVGTGNFWGWVPTRWGGTAAHVGMGFKVAVEIPGKSTSSSVCSSLFLVPLLLETLPKN